MEIIQDDLQEVISYGMSLGASYVELRTLEIEKTVIDLLDGKGKSVYGIDSGTAVRVVFEGAWGFVSIVSKKQQELKKAVKKACSLAKMASNYVQEKIELFQAEPLDEVVKIKLDVDPREIPTSEKKEKLIKFHNDLIEFDKRLKSTNINYADMTGTQYFQNSDGVQITTDKCITWAKFIANGQHGNIRAGGRQEIGSYHGYGIFNDEYLSEINQKLAKRVVSNLEADPGKGGTFPAILGPPVAGVFAHEACGHLFEADLTQTGVIGTVLGKVIATEHATIIDSGVIPEGIGSYKFDDEGTSAQETVILKKGRVNALLTNREYAKRFEKINSKLPEENKIQYIPSGNARAFDFRVAPIIRMRNTYFEPGDFSFEELLEGINFGYYLVDFRGGQATQEGTFTVGVQEAYEIVNGELGKPVRGVSLSGNTLETLHGISGVGRKDAFELHVGRCGKGQPAFTGDGGSNLRVDTVNISGEK
ncbi:MAG: metallopeptidase TldD-related protein [Candidatus Hodarchaeales archaeon]